jgi:MGT family glycosyltransferase
MKIFAYTSPARGHVFPTVPVLLELQRRGHSIVLRTLAAEVPRMRELGFTADPVSPEIEAIRYDDYLARSPVGAIKRSIHTGTRRAVLEAPEVERAIDAESPDALLIDTNTWGAAVAAEAWGGPWALLQHFPSPIPSREVPPFGPGFTPAAGPLGRFRDRLLRPIIYRGFERALLPPTNEVRRAAGLRPIRDAEDLYTRAPLVLYFTSTDFEYPRSHWPDSFCFLGPVVWEPPSDRPGWLDSITRPIVLVTTSSEFQDDAALVQTSLAGLADEDVEVLATMPAGVRSFPVPSNARVEQFVPHSHVLPHTEVVITHGGMGATQKALAAGVPVVTVPFGRDQAEVGRRAEATGAGVYLSKNKLSPEALRDAVRRARALKPAAEAFSDRMRREGGAPLAADRLEQLVGARVRHRRTG